MPEHPTPHDALFKAVFSKPENALAVFREALPAELVEAIEPGSLELEPGTFVDDELKERASDLLFKAKLRGRDALVYVLFEHQSTVDPLMPFRLLRYVVRVWEAGLRAAPERARLPAVVPLVLFQGPD